MAEMEFSSDMLQVRSSDPQREYHRCWKRNRKIKLSTHWGQRKLLINEILFLTRFWDKAQVSNPVIVYVGAASGNHIPVLSAMFPAIKEMHLYDPARFRIRSTDIIKLYNKKFTDKDAETWADREDVFFLSDIRVRSHRYERNSFKHNERGIIDDNQRQRRWVEIINPVQAHLKFRPPFPISEEFNQLEYFDGHLFYQPWAPIESAEVRLVPTKSTDGTYNLKIWDCTKHEQQLFHHNTVSRNKRIYKNPLESSHTGYDLIAEFVILQQYLLKMNRPADWGSVSKLSEYITQSLNKYGRSHTIKRLSR